MPCISDPEDGYRDCQRQIDNLTDMLCRVCLVLEQLKAIFPKDIDDWWEKHKEWDKKCLPFT